MRRLIKKKSRRMNVLKEEAARNFYTVRTAKSWNKIPDAVRNQKSTNAFKNAYDRWISTEKKQSNWSAATLLDTANGEAGAPTQERGWLPKKNVLHTRIMIQTSPSCGYHYLPRGSIFSSHLISPWLNSSWKLSLVRTISFWKSVCADEAKKNKINTQLKMKTDTQFIFPDNSYESDFLICKTWRMILICEN